MSAPAPSARRLGRFELRQLLGKSNATMAWLAFDPRGLEDARSAARLDHPNLAHVVEAGVQEHWPFVAVESPEALRAIANRSTASQPRQRYLSARTLLQALDGWRAAEAQDAGGPLVLLLDRIRTIGHLPTMPGIGGCVARLTAMEGQRTDEMADDPPPATRACSAHPRLRCGRAAHRGERRQRSGRRRFLPAAGRIARGLGLVAQRYARALEIGTRELQEALNAAHYADKSKAGGIDLGEKELSLRNEAVMAFKQAG